MLAVVAAMSFQTGCVRAMDENKSSNNATFVKNFIVAGIMSGFAIESANWVMREERYKNVFRFARRYPGFAVAGTTGVVGTAFLFGQPVIAQAQKLYAMNFGRSDQDE